MIMNYSYEMLGTILTFYPHFNGNIWLDPPPPWKKHIKPPKTQTHLDLFQRSGLRGHALELHGLMGKFTKKNSVGKKTNGWETFEMIFQKNIYIRLRSLLSLSLSLYRLLEEFCGQGQKTKKKTAPLGRICFDCTDCFCSQVSGVFFLSDSNIVSIDKCWMGTWYVGICSFLESNVLECLNPKACNKILRVCAWFWWWQCNFFPLLGWLWVNWDDDRTQY